MMMPPMQNNSALPRRFLLKTWRPFAIIRSRSCPFIRSEVAFLLRAVKSFGDSGFCWAGDPSGLLIGFSDGSGTRFLEARQRRVLQLLEREKLQPGESGEMRQGPELNNSGP
jgi:hypothetical protein